MVWHIRYKHEADKFVIINNLMISKLQ